MQLLVLRDVARVNLALSVKRGKGAVAIVLISITPCPMASMLGAGKSDHYKAKRCLC